jgi:hypothetical protein
VCECIESEREEVCMCVWVFRGGGSREGRNSRARTYMQARTHTHTSIHTQNRTRQNSKAESYQSRGDRHKNAASTPSSHPLQPFRVSPFRPPPAPPSPPSSHVLLKHTTEIRLGALVCLKCAPGGWCEQPGHGCCQQWHSCV